MSGTTDLAKSLQELRKFFSERRWKHCLIGGLAANRWGEARLTRDIDIAVFSGVGCEEMFVDELLEAFRPRAERRDVRQFALDNRVLLLNSSAGVPIDISLAALPFEEQMVARAKAATIVRGQKFQTASPEDIIVMKTIAGRAQDWNDIEGIIVKQGTKLDWDYVHRWLDPLLEMIERPERNRELETLRRRLAIESPSPLHPKTSKKRSNSPKKK